MFILASCFFFGDSAYATGSMFSNAQGNYTALKNTVDSDNNRINNGAFSQDIGYVKAALGLGFNFGNEMDWSYNNSKLRKYKIRFSVGYNDAEYYYHETFFNQAANLFNVDNRPSFSQPYAALDLNAVSGTNLTNSSPINYFKITISNDFTEAQGRNLIADVSYLDLLDKNGNRLINDSTILQDYTINLDASGAVVLNYTLNTDNGTFYGSNTKLLAAVQLEDYISDYKNNPKLIYSDTYNGEVATAAELEFLKAQGFRAIRLPVTWFDHMDYTGRVDPEWFAEVNSVVDRIIKYGFYVIVDIHHDTGNNGWIKADQNSFDEYQYAYRYLVLQFAENFKNYDHHLILEGPNEVLNYNNVRTGSNAVSSSDYVVANRLAQIFVDEVRNTGYNNTNRVLLLNVYAGYRGHITNFVLPTDSAEDKLFVGVHDYTIRNDGTLASLEYFNGAGNEYLSQYNLLVGEFGIQRTSALQSKLDLMSVSIPLGYQMGIPMFIWDDGGGYAIMRKQAAEWDNTYNSDQVAEEMLDRWRDNAISLEDARITLSLDTDSMTVNAYMNKFQSVSQTITSSTSNYTGYNVVIAPSDGNTALVGEGNSENVISPVSLPEGRDSIVSSEFGVGYGYSIDSTNYKPLGASGNPLLSKNVANITADNTTLTFGVKTDENVPSDSYSKTFVVTATANPVGYTINYDANTTDEVSNMPSSEQGSVSNLDIVLSNKTPVRVGHKFAGWSTVDDGTAAEYAAGDTYTLDYTTSNTVTLYAIWETACPVNSICYSANGADSSTSMSNQSASSGSSVTFLAPNFKYDDHGFVGWNTAADGSGTYYGPNQTVDNIGDLSVTGLRLYAIWLPSAGGLQSWTGCQNMASLGRIALSDARDNSTYVVTKLADGKCWMTENLRLNLKTATVNSYDTNNPATGFSAAASGIASTNTLFNDTNYDVVKFDADNINTTLSPSYNTNSNTSYWLGYGIYYNWYTATAGHGIKNKTLNDTISGSICPYNWRLPTGQDSSGDFSTLDRAIGGNGGYQTTAEASQRWRVFPNNFVYSGMINGSVPSTRGTNGYYWSSNPQNNNNAYRTYFNSTQVGPGTGNSNKYVGLSVRCLTLPVANYVVRFDGNGGGGAMGDQVINLGVATDISRNNYSAPSGKVFAGWNTEANGTGTSYSDGQTVTNLAAAGETIVLYAQWRTLNVTSFDNAFAAAGKTKMNGYYVMQDGGEQICNNVTIGQRTVLIDSRDNTLYNVARLADGNCWMLDNLRLDLSNSSVVAGITSANTNAATTSIEALNGTNVRDPSVSTNGQYATAGVRGWVGLQSYSAPFVQTAYADTTDSTSSQYGDGSHKYGIYYNYCAASAGSYCYGEDAYSRNAYDNASEDICPSNWHMPSNYDYLFRIAYKSNLVDFKNALSPTLSGIYREDPLSDAGSYGVFWTTEKNTENAFATHYLVVGTTYVDTRGSNARAFGASVRCMIGN